MNNSLSFWNDRAHLKEKAGTNDLIAKQLEIKAIKSYIRDGMKILDFGCGNGITAIEIAKEFNVDITGIDFSTEMVKEANNLLIEQSGLKGDISFRQGDILKLEDFKERGELFDIVYTERTIINIKPREIQKDAIKILCSLLKEGGKYLMCECSQNGLDTINELREKLSLVTIIPPWHTKYIEDDLIDELAKEMSCILTRVNHYSSLYYFLSRIINAYVSKEKGEEPDYNSVINQLALLLDYSLIDTDFAQGRIWVWEN